MKLSRNQNFAHRAAFVAVAMWLSLTAVADNETWFLVADGGRTVSMESVGSMVTTDANAAITVLDYDGSILLTDVNEVSFRLLDPSAVREVPATGERSKLLSGAVENLLTIIGAKDDVAVYTAAGALVLRQPATGGETVVNVSTLATGTYLVRTGRQSFKFIKK